MQHVKKNEYQAAYCNTLYINLNLNDNIVCKFKKIIHFTRTVIYSRYSEWRFETGVFEIGPAAVSYTGLSKSYCSF